MTTKGVTVNAIDYRATEAQMAVWANIDKKGLASTLNAKVPGLGVAFWRGLPKDTLVIVAGALDEHTADEWVEMTLAGGPDHDTRHTEGQDEPDGLGETTEAGIDEVEHEDYPGQHITGPETAPEGEAQFVQELAAIVTAPAKTLYALKVANGYLRRDQPRKTGDTAHYRVVGRDKASTYARREQAEIKVAEFATLQGGAAVAVVVVVL